jgi:lysophospholipase L1-like esterase
MWNNRFGMELLLLVGLAVPTFTSEGSAAEPAKKAATPAADRWEPAIRAFEAQDRKSAPAKGGIVFVGSSSIRLWAVEKSFAGMTVLNRGFGGSQMADSVRYAERIVTAYRPRVVVLYVGDNDLAAGKSPEQVSADYRQFVAKVHGALAKARIVYIAVKPSLARWKLIEKIRETNRLIRDFTGHDPRLVFIDVEKPMLGPDGKPRHELFLRDGLHLNAEGYRIWADLVRPHITGLDAQDR